MEINKVGDLIPYLKSLQELWGKEEFQPVLALFKGLHQEQVGAVQSIKLDNKSEDIKAEVAVLKSRLNLLSLFYNLPENVRKAKEDFESRAVVGDKLEKAREGGSI